MGMNRGRHYASAIFDLCEQASAKRVLEIGCGSMTSGMAIVESLSKRAPGLLVTVELNRETQLPGDLSAWAQSLGVTWCIIHGDATKIGMVGQYDLIHVDGVGISPEANEAAFTNLCHLLKPGGIYAVAGASEEYPGIVEGLSRSEKCRIVPFDETHGHAVIKSSGKAKK